MVANAPLPSAIVEEKQMIGRERYLRLGDDKEVIVALQLLVVVLVPLPPVVFLLQPGI